jgi:hypothetical protein
VTRLGFKPVLMGGLLLVAAGLVWFSQVSVGGSYTGDVLFASIIAGAGLGFSFVPVTIGAVAGTKEDESGLASGLINTSQQIGGALGLAVLSTIAFADVPGGGRPDPAALTGGSGTRSSSAPRSRCWRSSSRPSRSAGRTAAR